MSFYSHPDQVALVSVVSGAIGGIVIAAGTINPHVFNDEELDGLKGGVEQAVFKLTSLRAKIAQEQRDRAASGENLEIYIEETRVG